MTTAPEKADPILEELRGVIEQTEDSSAIRSSHT